MKHSSKLNLAEGIQRSEDIAAGSLEMKPNNADEYYNLGIQMTEQGRHQDAIICYRKTLEINPDDADAYYNMGIEFYSLGEIENAISCYRHVIKMNPNDFHAYNNMGIVLKDQGKIRQAIACHRKALEINPGHVHTHNNMGAALMCLDELEEAVACYRKAIKITPNDSQLYSNMGIAYMGLGKAEDAIECYRKALEIDPANIPSYNGMGATLSSQGKIEEAILYYRKALELDPDDFAPYFNLGNALKSQSKTEEAIECYRKAVKINPSHVHAYNNMGIALFTQGKTEEAIECYQKATAIISKGSELCNSPSVQQHYDYDTGGTAFSTKNVSKRRSEDALAHCNLIFTLQYVPDMTGERLIAECRRWDTLFGSHQKPVVYKNNPDPNRRLKVGYVSPDFHGHAAAFLLEPLLASHDKTAVEVFCYAEVRSPDSNTEKFQKHADKWRVTVGVSDKDMADMIRADKIDILVDCGGYSDNNRLTALTHRPAPIQISSMFGHGGATGLRAFDYVLTDQYLTPPGFENHFSEEIIRLPNHIAPFTPLSQYPDVSPSNASRSGRIVFACFAALARISQKAFNLWRRILEGVPGATLLVKNAAFSDAGTLESWRDMFSSFTDRVDFEGVPGGWAQNMDVYRRIDIVLDSFPASGHTVSLIPLWMGVPVVSYSGKHAAQRFGTSVLSNVGLSELLAETEDEYVEKAIRLASDLEKLQLLRKTLRKQMADSVICDSRQIASDIELEYRRIWKKRCASQR